MAYRKVLRVPPRAGSAWERVCNMVRARFMADSLPSPPESEVLAVLISSADLEYGGLGVPPPNNMGYEQTPLMSIDDRLERIEKALGIEGPTLLRFPPTETETPSRDDTEPDDIIGLYEDGCEWPKK